MTGEEAKKALLAGSPVAFNHPESGRIIYEKIYAIRYMKGINGVAVSLELLDKNGRSVTVAPTKEVELYKEQTIEGLRYSKGR